MQPISIFVHFIRSFFYVYTIEQPRCRVLTMIREYVCGIEKSKKEKKEEIMEYYHGEIRYVFRCF